jgi:hypothetical protein
MKKTLMCLVGALLLVSPRLATADVSVDFFYNNLSGGSWVEVDDYGYCWQPDVAVSNTTWRPYADGYWAYTDLGWTWVSYEDFGWATYHYGRWARLSDYGWVWVPGRDRDLEWGPAWVSWRTGGQYIGWAPLPPETIGIVESGPITGHIDVQFNIGPAYYNFVDVRYIGEPVLRERIYAPTQNVTYIQQTVNVTNITYNNNAVYNYGPDINVVNRSSTRQIQRLRLDRQQNVDVTAAARGGGLTKVQGDRLVVAAPAKITRSAGQVAPQKIKTKVAAAKVDRGWSAVGDEKAQNEFKQRLRNENAQNVQASTGTQATTGASPATAAGSPASTNASPSGTGNAGTAAAAGAAGAAAGQAASNANDDTAQTKQSRGRKGQGRGQNDVAGASASPATSPNAAGAAAQTAASPSKATAQEGRRGRGGRGQGRNGERAQQPGADTGAAGSTASQSGAGAADEAVSQGEESPGSARHTARGQGDQPAAMSQGNDEQNSSNQGAARQDRQGRQFRNRPTQSAPSDVQGQPGGPHRQGRAQGQEAGQGGGEQHRGQGQGRGRGQGHQGQGPGQGESPAATPQP